MTFELVVRPFELALPTPAFVLHLLTVPALQLEAYPADLAISTTGTALVRQGWRAFAAEYSVTRIALGCPHTSHFSSCRAAALVMAIVTIWFPYLRASDAEEITPLPVLHFLLAVAYSRNSIQVTKS